MLDARLKTSLEGTNRWLVCNPLGQSIVALHHSEDALLELLSGCSAHSVEKLSVVEGCRSANTRTDTTSTHTPRANSWEKLLNLRSDKPQIYSMEKAQDCNVSANTQRRQAVVQQSVGFSYVYLSQESPLNSVDAGKNGRRSMVVARSSTLDV